MTGLRLLAIAADRPEATPGETVALTALWFDPAESAPSFAWTSCVLADPSDPDSCPEDPDALAEGQALDATSVTLPGEPGALLVQLRLTSGDSVVEGYKRVEASEETAPNTNPSIADVLVDGGSLQPGESVAAATRQTVSLSVEAAAAEPDDELIVSWFATAGEFDEERSIAGSDGAPFEVDWTAPRDPAEVTMWFVLRDGRGGVAWQTIALVVD